MTSNASKHKVTDKDVARKLPFFHFQKTQEDFINLISEDNRSAHPNKKPQYTGKTLKFTMPSRGDITYQEVKDIMSKRPLDDVGREQHNSIKMLKSVFQNYLCDYPDDKYVNIKKLAYLLKEFGLVEIKSENDLDILLDTVDKDKDGKFTFQDFVNNFPMFEYSQVFDKRKSDMSPSKFLTELGDKSPKNKAKKSLSPMRGDQGEKKKIKVDGFDGKVGQVYFMEAEKFEKVKQHNLDKARM